MLPFRFKANLIWVVGIVLVALSLGTWLFVIDRDIEVIALAVPIGPIVLDATSPDGATYVGGANCRDCHQQEYDLWHGSHHDLAMKPAEDDSVLGDFDNASFEHHGVTTTFYRRNDAFYVRTEGDDGKLHEYQVLYTFGWTPLQQYLVAFPDGRMQVLPTCWDARPADQGGQRWFHLYGDERIAPDDPLFWTGPNQNWNFMCAECHSTNLKKNYDATAATYRTSWSQVNVSCEACHGPGSNHLQWAKGKPLDAHYPDSDDKGLAVRLGVWGVDDKKGDTIRKGLDQSRMQVEACARCHARRAALTDDYIHGRSIHDTHRVELLSQLTYHTDGQILDEVYVYGSFVQSKMYHAGVTCTDCHQPHSLELRRPGNRTCTQCHEPDRYDTVSHHFHPTPGAGTNCIDCHMIERTYMQVDPRRDHSFRKPRPDLTLTLGTPNACNDCHNDQTAQWAWDSINKWYGTRPVKHAKPHFGEAIGAARRGLPGAADLLAKLIDDADQPAIARATALADAGSVLTPQLLRSAVAALKDPDPMVRAAALGNLRVLPPDERWRLAASLLNDPIKSVRLEAVLVLAAARNGMIDEQSKKQFDAASAEYHTTQRQAFDRASGHFSIGQLHAELGQNDSALAAYRRAIDTEPWFVPAIVNLALLQRQMDRADESHETLVAGAKRAADIAAMRYQLGMSYVRRREVPAGLAELEAAAELDPETPRFAYGYAIALNSTGQGDKAIDVLTASLKHFPHDRATLFALATICRDRGQRDNAIRYAEQLVRHWPTDLQARQLLQSLALDPRKP